MTACLDAAETILRERARRLALSADAREERPDRAQAVVFESGGERYGVEGACVSEVRSAHQVTPLPGTPPLLLGVMNHRGRILAVVDIRRMFELSGTGISDRSRVLVLKTDDAWAGLLADEVLGTRFYEANQLRPNPATSAGLRADCAAGLTLDHTVILDVKTLMARVISLVNVQGEVE